MSKDSITSAFNFAAYDASSFIDSDVDPGIEPNRCITASGGATAPREGDDGTGVDDRMRGTTATGRVGVLFFAMP